MPLRMSKVRRSHRFVIQNVYHIYGKPSTTRQMRIRLTNLGGNIELLVEIFQEALLNGKCSDGDDTLEELAKIGKYGATGV